MKRVRGEDIGTITIVATMDAIDRIGTMMKNLNKETACGHSIGVYSDDKPPVCIGSFDGDGCSRIYSFSTSEGKTWFRYEEIGKEDE